MLAVYTQNFAKAIYHDFYIYKLAGVGASLGGEEAPDDKPESNGDDKDQ